MKEISKPKRKRKRVNPTHVWTDLQTQMLLQAVCDTFKDQEQFEKPTSEAYYCKIKEKAPILEPISWLSLKCKMRHLKAKYRDAVCWKDKTGNNGPANGKDYNMIEFIDKISPYWDSLADIFSHRNYARPSIVYETANDVDTTNAELSNTFDGNHDDSSDGELELKYKPATPQPSTSQSSVDFTNAIDKRISLELQTSRQNPLDITENPTNHMPIKKSCANEQPLENVPLIKEQGLALERDKLELEKEKLRNDFELRKIELQNEFELKKFEIGLRVESDERIKKYEIDLKYKSY